VPGGEQQRDRSKDSDQGGRGPLLLNNCLTLSTPTRIGLDKKKSSHQGGGSIVRSEAESWKCPRCLRQRTGEKGTQPSSDKIVRVSKKEREKVAETEENESHEEEKKEGGTTKENLEGKERFKFGKKISKPRTTPPCLQGGPAANN